MIHIKPSTVVRSLPTLLLLGLVALAEQGAVAAKLRHILEGRDSGISQQTQRACGVYADTENLHWCNPALFSVNSTDMLRADGLLRADERRAYSTQDAIAGHVNKDSIAALFSHDDFASYSGVARIEAQNSYFAVSYTPYHLVGAYRLSNPALPHLDLSAATEDVFRVDSGIRVAPEFMKKQYEILLGGGVYRYHRNFYYFSGNTLEFLVRPFEELLDETTEAGFGSDLGLVLLSRTDWLPSFGVNLFRVFEPWSGDDDERLLSINHAFRRAGSAHVGWTFHSLVGNFSFEFAQPFNSVLKSKGWRESIIAGTYGIGHLRAFTSYSAYLNTFGFHFLANHYQVGIQYTDEKQDNEISLQRQKNTYLFGTLFI